MFFTPSFLPALCTLSFLHVAPTPPPPPFNPPGRGNLRPQLDSAMQDVSDKYLLLEETEKQAVRKALVEERSRFCCFVSMLRPVVVSAPPRHPHHHLCDPRSDGGLPVEETPVHVMNLLLLCLCVRRRRCPCLGRSLTCRL